VDTAPIENTYRQIRRSPWTVRFARLGFAAKGIVYLAIAYLAALTAVHRRGSAGGAKDAVTALSDAPLGTFAIGVIAFGLLGYVAWRMIEAISDPERHGSGAKGVAHRAGALFSGLAYASVSVYAFELLFGGPAEAGDDTRTYVARLIAKPYGEILVALAGLAVIGTGIVHLGIAWRRKFRKNLKTSQMSSGEIAWLDKAGFWGYSARAVVLLIIGWFLSYAALRSDARQARGLKGALQYIARQDYGPYLLGLVAVGLAGYGVLMLFEARYRKM
jgi:hypothetical protein